MENDQAIMNRHILTIYKAPEPKFRKKNECLERATGNEMK